MSLEITPNDHFQGKPEASLVIIEYGDYQCPYCKQAYYRMKEVMQELGDKVLFVFRNFPLADLHPNAVHAAIATETAAGQGKFWEMHDILFENQKHLTDSDIIQYAKTIGLNVAEFAKDFGKDPFYHKVNTDYESGIDNEVEETPTFFINGQKYEGNWNSSRFIDYLKSLLEEELV